jgi:hypothetical protein
MDQLQLRFDVPAASAERKGSADLDGAARTRRRTIEMHLIDEALRAGQW